MSWMRTLGFFILICYSLQLSISSIVYFDFLANRDYYALNFCEKRDTDEFAVCYASCQISDKMEAYMPTESSHNLDASLVLSHLFFYSQIIYPIIDSIVFYDVKNPVSYVTRNEYYAYLFVNNFDHPPQVIS